jgi:vacuolar-type H+-ATPase subunit E/Vma4
LCVHSFFIPEALRRAEECADDLEEKLKASEEAREKAEKDAAGVEDLRRRLQAAKDALSDRETKLVQCDNDIITLLETQSRRFSSNTISPFVVQFSLSR